MLFSRSVLALMFLPVTHTTASISRNVCGFNTFCSNACSKQHPIPCKRKDSSSGVCNGYDKKSSYKLTKKFNELKRAQIEYEYTLKDSRMGWDLSSSEAKDLTNTLKPLIEKGQSIAHILMTHPQKSNTAKKTIYNYIEQGAFVQFGVKNIDLRIKMRR